MDQSTLALWISGLAGGASVISTAVAVGSVVVARSARDDARTAATNALWSDHLANLHALVGLDPIVESIGDPMRQFRVSAMNLADGLPRWEGFDRWLGAEHALVAALFNEVMADATPHDRADRRFELMKPVLDWGIAHSNNLRHLRNTGYDRGSIESLARIANGAREGIYKKRGWPEPEAPVFRPLEAVDDAERE